MRFTDRFGKREGTRRLALFFLTLALGLPNVFATGEPPVSETKDAPRAVLYSGGPGRFEVVTVTPALGQAVVDLGERVWVQLAPVLGLPPQGFTSAITIKLVPTAQWNGPEAFHVWPEFAGRMTLGIPVGDTFDAPVVLRAMVNALLTRRAANNVDYGYAPHVPLWLELAATRWVQARMQPALHDEWQQEVAGGNPPPLLAVLSWQPGMEAPPTLAPAGYGVMLWLYALGRDNGQWMEFLRRQLAGVPAANSLGAFVGQPWKSYDDVELAWRVALEDMRRQELLPSLSIDGSRVLLKEWSRVILHDVRRRADVVVTAEDQWAHRADPAVRSVAADHTAVIEGKLGLLHPFYRNAANSLGRFYYLVARGKSKADALGAWKQFEADFASAEDLAATSASLLDRAQAAASR